MLLSALPTVLERLQNNEITSLALLFIVLSTAFLLITSYNNSRAKLLRLPPSPPKLPIIGHLHQLGALPHHSLKTLAEKHGPLMLLHFGHTPTIVVSSPQAAREIMKTHDLIFSSRPDLRVAKRLFYEKDIAFVPYGEYWRQMKRICIVQLLTAKRVQCFRSVREEETNLMIEKISSSSPSLVNLSGIMMSLTNDTTCRVALGKKYSEEEVAKRFERLLMELSYLLGASNVGDFIPWLGWINRFNGFNARVENHFKEMDLFLDSVIEDHLKKKKKREEEEDVGDPSDHDYEDLVDVLLGIDKDGSSTTSVSVDRDNIKAIILDMFAGGTDTSHSALEWAMAELIRHPKIMKKVQEEAREIAKGKQHVTEDDITRMSYLQCVIKETLRLHPPLPLLVPRESTEDVKILGYDIPAKTRVLINSWAIGRDPESWKEPDKFEPERFMNNSIDYKGTDFEFIPFGAGRRGCPGMTFATTTIELALANLLYRFDWKLPDGAKEDELDMVEGPGIVVHKKFPLLVVATDNL